MFKLNIVTSLVGLSRKSYVDPLVTISLFHCESIMFQTDPGTILKCLTITAEMMQDPQLSRLTPSLRTLIDTLVCRLFSCVYYLYPSLSVERGDHSLTFSAISYAMVRVIILQEFYNGGHT